MYPYIELKIENNVPKIVYYPNENQVQEITQNNENLTEIIIDAAKSFDLVEEDAEYTQENLDTLLDLARQSDETLFTDLPTLDTETIEFNLTDTLIPYVEAVLDGQEEAYNEINMTDEVRDQLSQNVNADNFASYLETLYSILIAKTILAASEMGIGNIHLNDDSKNPRLMEKMAKELDKMGLDLIIS
ncbi:hypothetical protein DOJK_00887 [Patescibacteria group bacterium]|jgi:hypothetical protein|nr:hypothetical protein [Candidatus Dojkabacteria bacterium]CAG1021281.1 hypothetical protein DOJK_00887 [Patescibacteria group bacterium]